MQPAIVLRLQSLWRRRSPQRRSYYTPPDGAAIMARVQALLLDRVCEDGGGTFDALVALLKEQPVIDATTAALRHLSCTPFLPRVFLSAFMLVHWRGSVIVENEDGPLERALFASATELLRRFDEAIHVPRPPGARGQFVQALRRYARHLAAWQRVDAPRVVVRLKHALLSLYQYGRDEEELRRRHPDLHASMGRLRAKLLDHMGEQAFRAFEADAPRRRRSLETDDGARKKAARLS